jgi:hypothetical protein
MGMTQITCPLKRGNIIFDGFLPWGIVHQVGVAKMSGDTWLCPVRYWKGTFGMVMVRSESFHGITARRMTHVRFDQRINNCLADSNQLPEVVIFDGSQCLIDVYVDGHAITHSMRINEDGSVSRVRHDVLAKA